MCPQFEITARSVAGGNKHQLWILWRYLVLDVALVGIVWLVLVSNQSWMTLFDKVLE